ncbi:MAG: PKD domain-containing protein [Vicingaceae bacterium]
MNRINAFSGLLILALIALGNSASVKAQACDTITADFSSNSPRCTGEDVDFVYTQPAYGGMTYLWDFGSGASPATSTAQNPTGVVYSTSGLKLVSVTVTITIGLTTCVKTKTSGVNIVQTPNPSFSDNGPQCEGAEVNFTYSGTTGTGWTYNWDFGTGASPSGSSAQNPSGVKYNGSGSKTVTLTVSNASCDGTTNQSITILDKPDAGFSVASTACTGDGVNFTNTGTTSASYSWSLGSGAAPSTSTFENPAAVTYSTPGSKTVQQIITLGSCSDTSIQSLNVLQSPVAAFSSNAAQCEGAPVNFSYTGTTGTGWTYSWDFGNGSSPSVSTAQNPQGVIYTGAGSKAISLTVTNQTCSNVLNSNISINPTPQSGFSSSSPACSNDSVNFSNTGTSGISWSWNFGSGATPASSITENPLGVIYSSPGIKSVQQIALQGGCSDTTFGSVNVTESPVPSFSSTSPQCEGAGMDFAYSGSTGTGWTYLWDFGSGASPAISTAQNPIGISYTGSGTKTVTLTVSNQFCSETFVGNVTVNPSPTASFSSNAPGCTGDSINFLNTGSTGLTYAWDFGSGASPTTATSESPMGIIYSMSGTKSVRQVITQGTCTDTAYLFINLKQTPSPDFDRNAPIQCEGSSIAFNYTGSTGTGWTYLWDFGSGSNPAVSSAQTPGNVTYNGSGVKNISLTVTNQGCAETFSDTLTIDLTPVASFSSTAPGCTGDSLFFSNTGTTGVTGTSYVWSFSNANPPSSVQEDPGGIVFSTPGAQSVKLVSQKGNCIDSSSQFITVHQTPAVSFSSNAPICALDAVNFTNTGSSGNAWNYLWDFGSGSSPSLLTSENPGNIRYNTGGTKIVSLSLSDANCTNSDTMSIEIHDLPIAVAGLDTTICADECVRLGSTSVIGNTYHWFPSSTLDSANAANPIACPLASINSYVVTVEDGNACMNSDTVVVTMLPSAIAKAGNDVEVCINDTVQIGTALIEGQTYLWTPSNGLNDNNIPSPFASPDSTTVYQVSVSYRGCPAITDDVLVTVHQTPLVSAGDDVTIAKGSSEQLLATGAIQYQWSPITGLSNPAIANPLASPDETTSYIVTFTDINSCISVDTITVSVIDAGVWAPDIFTPNGDGRNDVFRIETNGATDFELTIYSRSGEVVFRSTDPLQAWDGTRQGSANELPTGAYVYSSRGQLSDGTSFSLNGMINLVRY